MYPCTCMCKIQYIAHLSLIGNNLLATKLHLETLSAQPKINLQK